MFELQKYMAVMFDGTEYWCIIWAFKSDMRNFANFHQSTFESLKIGTLMGSFYLKQKMYGLQPNTLMGCFWPKYIMLELKNYRRVIFDDTEEWCKIWRKTDLCFLKWRDFILESKIAELNENKNSKQPDRPDTVWKLSFVL